MTDFDHIRQFTDDEFFPLALGLKKVPSSETLRQRFEKIAQDQQSHGGHQGLLASGLEENQHETRNH